MSSTFPTIAKNISGIARTGEFSAGDDCRGVSEEKDFKGLEPFGRNCDDQAGPEAGAHSIWSRISIGLTSSSVVGYTISTVIHALLVVGFSIVLVPASSGSGEFSTLISVGDVSETKIGGLDRLDIETRFDLEGSHRVELESPLTPNLDELRKPDILEGALDRFLVEPSLSSKEGQGEGDNQGDGSRGDSGGFQLPSSGKVFTRGSFTAWTIPEDPGPRENYLIVIQVKLPPKYKSLPLNDVTGLVTGTDGYRLMINAYTSKYLHKTKQIVLRIPGAESQIRDTIRVHSHILKEEQEITIEF